MPPASRPETGVPIVQMGVQRQNLFVRHLGIRRRRAFRINRVERNGKALFHAVVVAQPLDLVPQGMPDHGFERRRAESDALGTGQNLRHRLAPDKAQPLIAQRLAHRQRAATLSKGAIFGGIG